MTPEEIANKAIEKLNSKITNEIFTIIQNDRELMHVLVKPKWTRLIDNFHTQPESYHH